LLMWMQLRLLPRDKLVLARRCRSWSFWDVSCYLWRAS
jgi:hypothetical protein